MGIIIHQSQCGENDKKAWNLLKTTMSDIPIAKAIAYKTDLQDQAAGVVWKPTVRGFVQDNFFLLMKTFPDKSPDVRPGRVFSHVLIISKKDIDSIVDIGSLFKFLPDEIDKSISLEPIKYNSNELSEIIYPAGFQERFNKVIHGFNKGDEYKNTIIWVGEEYFEQAVSKYWKILSSTEKENLHFGIYFNVAAIPEKKLNFITIPENIETKFINHGFCLIRKNDTYTLTGISEQFLAGDSNAGQRIKRFQDAIEARQFLRTDIENVAKVIKTFEEIDSIFDVKKINTLSHIVAQYSPDEKRGIIFKERLVNRICKLIEEEDDEIEIQLIRNFNIKSSKDSEFKLSVSVSKWLTKYMFSQTGSKQKNFSALFKQVRDSKEPNWFIKLIDNAINAFLDKINSPIRCIIIFNWIQSDFEIFQGIQSRIDHSKESENFFISALPSGFDKSHLKALREFAINRSWLKFHATLLKLEYSFNQAISEQIAVDTELSFMDGIEIIIKEVEPKAIIDVAVSNGDKRLTKISGKLCNEDPSFLAAIDFANGNWQEVWLYSIECGNQLTDGFKEPRKKIFELFDIIADGSSINEQLLEKISETEYGNLLGYDKREMLWGKFSLTIRAKFLKKTSTSLLESLSNNPMIEVPNDNTLADYIIKYAIEEFLYYNRNNLKSTLPIFSKFGQISESIVKDYISNYFGNIEALEAMQLGKLVTSKNYSNVANTIFLKASSNNNWRIALYECRLLISNLNQIVSIFTGIIHEVEITSDQWWQGTEEIIVDLYSNNISIITLWKKAGGKESELLTHSTAKDIWQDLISRIRKGSFKNISMNSLLKEIKKDYDSNEKFMLIYDLRKKFINTE